MREHSFTPVIRRILADTFGNKSEEILQNSDLLKYLNIKMVSANRGSKARSSFGNIYAIYVVVEDYVKGGFHESGGYSKYEGAQFSNLFSRQRELPFGSKLQNHALNHRLNQEFRKYFPTSDFTPLMRDTSTNRYWINEELLKVAVNDEIVNIAPAILAVVEAYIAAKEHAFTSFISDCERMASITSDSPDEVVDFISGLFRPNVDARIFEIISFCVLKAYYSDISIFWGWSAGDIGEEQLILYKTGRTNANDGGIDFVMRPLGRFFQVTETLDVKKYFLDIDKIQRYPMTFVVKSELDADDIRMKISEQAERQFPVAAIVERYMECVEEVINIPILLKRLRHSLKAGKLKMIIEELVRHSHVEFNVEAA